jgi:protein-S-isoprenylcysteine O-methyltransferase Ste14
MRTVKLTSAAFAILHLMLILKGRVISPTVQAVVAMALYLGALGLFWWALSANRAKPLSAVFSPDLPIHLTQAGPYRFIRHPFYASYLLTWVAGVIASGYPWLLLTVVVMGIIYLRAAQTEERKFSASPLARQYEFYRSRTGLFTPNPLKLFGLRRN